MLDKLSVSLTGEELEVVERLYHQAMKLEVEFILTQPVVNRTIAPVSQLYNSAEENLIIFCDFDLTCTAIDSSALVAEIAIVAASKADLSGGETQPSQMSCADIRMMWSNLFSQYIEEYEQCIESIMPNEAGINKFLLDLIIVKQDQHILGPFGKASVASSKSTSNFVKYFPRIIQIGPKVAS